MRFSRRLALLGVAVFGLVLASGRLAHAQYLESYFPSGVPGYDTRRGVTVISRARPEFQTPGIHAGSFIIRPRLDEAFGYDSNPAGTSRGGSSVLLRTSPSITANSNWSRNALGLSISADDYQYFDLPRQSYTNWTAVVGGGYTIGRSNLNLAYAHLSLNQKATEVGALQTDTPVHFNVDDVRSDYTFDLGRISITPSIDVRHYTFDNTSLLGRTVSQAYRNHVALTGGATARYSLSDQRNLVFVVQGVDNSFTDEVPGQPTNDSRGVIALGGIDYQADGPWIYRLLAGVEEREFSAAQYKSHVAPIVAGEVIWTPTGLTTLTGSVARTIEAAASEGNAGFTYTTARIVVDHELFRNILLQGRSGFQVAEYLEGGGSQTSYSVGAGVNWLVNRNVRLSLDYNFSQLTGSQISTFNGVPNITTANSTSSSRNLALLTLHLGL